MAEPRPQEKHALISVYDKTDIEVFAEGLTEDGFNIFASGGTAKRLDEAGIAVTDVAELTGGGSILGHRVVTLSREVYAALLAQNTPEDLAELDRLGIPYIDLVAVDMYPLAQTIADPTSTELDVIGKTDIGGPTMLRAGAKGRRIVLSRVEQRPEVIEWLRAGRPNNEEFRRKLAAIAEYEVASYVLDSARYLGGPAIFGFIGEKISSPLYGENPQQGGAGIYMRRDGKNPLAYNNYEQHGGIETSYNNVVEFAERMTQTITHVAAGFEENFGEVPALAVGVKHGNACGAAYADSSAEVIRKMLEGDERAIFGGSIMLNFEIDEKLAEILLNHNMKDEKKRLLDIVVAAGITDGAKELLQRKTGKLRLLTNPALASLGKGSLDTDQRFRYIPDGMAVQDNYTVVPNLRRQAEIAVGGWVSPEQERDLVLAWGVGSTTNSNTITVVKGGMVIGNGAGQQDRVGAADLALKRAHDAGHTRPHPSVVWESDPDAELETPVPERLIYKIDGGAVAYSDSFFPFPDGAERLAEAGVNVILTSSGSNNDETVFARLQKLGIQSVITLPDKKFRGFFGH